MTYSHTPSFLYTADAGLARRVHAYLDATAVPRDVDTPAALKLALQQFGNSLVFFDIRGAESLPLLREIVRGWPEAVIIAFGVPRSEPYQEAVHIDVYAVHPLDFDGEELEALTRRAFDRLALGEELRALRRQANPQPAPAAPTPQPRTESALALRQFSQPLRHFDNVEGLLQGIVDGIASTAVVLRAGIFAAIDDPTQFVYRAGIGCLDDTRDARYGRDHALVRWMELNPQVVYRERLANLAPPADQVMLARELDVLGADIVVRLQGRGRLLGMLFLGRRATGGQFSDTDLQDLMILVEHLSTSLENAMLYREVGMQKTFAETLLHSLPTAVVAATQSGQVYWVNDAAEVLLSLKREEVMNRPIGVLGPRLSHHLAHALAGEADADAVEEWTEPETERHLSVRAVPLRHDDDCRGAVAFVYDHTREHALNKRQQELERAQFWTELAANMSHEIRNPMVAIKTFAQLLPERYADAEFRSEFSELVTRDVDRLNAIIQQINTFANLPTLNVEPIDVREAIASGRNEAAVRIGASEPAYQIDINDNLPPILGDRHALTECFAHVFANAMEAMQQTPMPLITLKATPVAHGNDEPEAIEIHVRDNGGGMRDDIRTNVFSPFCTTKERAMGLGLSIVQRTVADHHGKISVDADDTGTHVVITLPVAAKREEQPADETLVDR